MREERSLRIVGVYDIAYYPVQCGSYAIVQTQ